MTRKSVRKTPALAILRFLLLLWLAAHGQAQPLSDLTPVRADEVKSGSLLIKTDQPGVFLPAPALETDVAIRVSGIVARASVRQRFFNPAGDCVEAVYVFPLPESAAVDRMRLTIGPRVIEAEIREREEAKKVYEQAKSEGKKAALLEQERPNVFTASVASIGPNEEVEVEIEYQETLRYDAGKFHLRFPMVVAPRYIPGTAVEAGAVSPAGTPGPAPKSRAGTGWALDTDSVPDASRITPAVLRPGETRANPARLRVELESGVRLRRLESATHRLAAAPVGEASYAVTVADQALNADRDFELEWEPDLGDRPKPAVFAEDRDGQVYAVLVVMPPDAPSVSLARLPRETVFIIDTSGSMHGASLEQARGSLAFALDRLRPEDRFNVIEFNSRLRLLYPESRRAHAETVREAKEWVSKLQADGGTEMLPALRAALEGADGGSEVRQVVFMTDGGVGNEEQLFRYIREHLGRSRLFTVGIGSAPNSHFMTKAAEFGRGTFTYIGSPGEVAEKMGRLFRKLESPVLTDVRVEWNDAGFEAWPSKIPDLYAGEPLIVAARLASADGGVKVSGTRSGEWWTERVPIRLLAGESGVDALWGRRKIEALMDRITEGADREKVRCEVVETALRHHLVSSFTSLVAVDLTPTLARGAVCTTRAVPVHLPAGWDYGHVFGQMPQTATPAGLCLLLGAALAVAALVLRRLAPGGVA
jgi:Ca-activated chloride channel family protein